MQKGSVKRIQSNVNSVVEDVLLTFDDGKLPSNVSNSGETHN
jgi:hypothetical protein